MKIFLSVLGGFGDSLVISMPVSRLKKLFPDSEIVVSGNKEFIQILGSNSNITEIRTHGSFNDLPVLNPKFDIVMDFRYGVKTFFPTGKKYDLDIPAELIERRQKEVELDLWINDIPYYRMMLWQQNLEKFRSIDKFGLGEKMNWYSIISYLSGLNFTTDDMFIHTEKIEGLPKKFIAVSSPCPLRGYSKLWPDKYWNKVFKAFPKETFVLFGISENKCLEGKNIIHFERKSNIFQTAFALSKAKFLISEEGGLVHINRAVKKRSVVIFASTQDWFFSHPENINIVNENRTCNFCHNQHIFWMDSCRLRKQGESQYCKNAEAILPKIVIKEVEKLLTDKEV